MRSVNGTFCWLLRSYETMYAISSLLNSYFNDGKGSDGGGRVKHPVKLAKHPEVWRFYARREVSTDSMNFIINSSFPTDVLVILSSETVSIYMGLHC